MKTWKKRSLAAALAILMALSCAVFGVTAFAAENEDVPAGWWYFNGILPATTTKDGEAEYESSEGEIDTFITRKIKSVELSVSACQYVGKPRVPKVTVKNSLGKVIDSRFYKVTMSKNTHIGTASVKVDFNKGLRREQGVDDESGTALYEGVVTKTFKIYMVAPTVVNADKGFKITWKPQANATGYEVWRSKDGGSYVKAKTLSGNSSTTFTNTNDAADVNGSKYQFKIKPIISGGSGGFSNVKTSYKVARPTISSITNTSKGFKLTWSKNSKATGYQIWRSDDGGKTYIKAKTITNAGTTSFSNSAAAVNKNGKKYYYKMRTYKTVGGVNYYSTFSPVKSITRKM